MFKRILKWLFGATPLTSSVDVPLPQNSVDGSDAEPLSDDLERGEPTPRRKRRPPVIGQNTLSEQATDLSGLDSQRFAPLDVDDAQRASRTHDWQSANWDPMDRIPAEEIPRIKDVDSKMVGLGLISADELKHIHDVGRQIELFGHHTAVKENAVVRPLNETRQIRAQRKVERKAEADERRRLRKLEIAERRAGDIIFLGRGVSRGLADRRSDVETLQAAGLPVLSCPADVANVLGISIGELRWLAFHSEAATTVHYFFFEVPRKSGGTRLLAAPHRKLSHAQRWILKNVLSQLRPHDAAHGFVEQRSILTNAERHVNSAVVVNADLSEFFPSISFYRVEGMFRRLGYSPAVATIFALLCTECPRRPLTLNGVIWYAAIGDRSLPQGACTSPAISNLICRRLDIRLARMAQTLGWTYTRYADDITWSSVEDSSATIGYVLSRIEQIINDEGFEVNHKKTRVLRSSACQMVTGIVVNDRPGVPRKTVRRIRAILHNAKRTGLQAQNRENHPDFTGWLQGMISWISMVNPEQGLRLQSAFLELMPNR